MTRDRLPLAALLLLTILLAWPSITLPPGRDQAIFTVVGRAIADGGLPYRDAFDFKPPGIHLFYALSHLLGGGNMVVTHLLDRLAVLATMGGLYVLLSHRSRVGALAAGAVYGAAYLATLRYWDLAQPESILAMCVVLSLVAFRRSASAPGFAIWSGILLGIACWMKYNAILFAPLFLVVDRLAVSPGEMGRGRRLGLLAGGFAIPVAVVVAWLVAGHAWGPFREIQTEYLPGYSRLVLAGGLGVAVESSLRIVGDFFVKRPLWLAPILIGIPLTIWRGRRPGRWVPIMGLALGTAGVIAQGKFFHYHWIPCLPFVAWLAGETVAAAWGHASDSASGAIRRGLVVAILLAAAGISTAPVAEEKVAAARAAFGVIDRRELARHEAFGRVGIGDHAFGATLAASRMLTEISDPGDRVFVWGFEPWLYIEADRPPASRFIYNVAFLSPWCPPSWSRELIDDLRSDPPDVIVVLAFDALPWVTGVPIDSRSGLAAVPGLPDFLRSRYGVAGREEHFTFFRLSE